MNIPYHKSSDTHQTHWQQKLLFTQFVVQGQGKGQRKIIHYLYWYTTQMHLIYFARAPISLTFSQTLNSYQSISWWERVEAYTQLWRYH